MDKKGVIIHLDNDDHVLTECKGLFDQNELNLEYITCSAREQFEKVINENKGCIKGLIFDLLSSEPSSGEINNHDAEFLATVEQNFASLNVPIFVYSGYLQAIEGIFDSHGTVFKIDKGNDDFQEKVIEKIALLLNSGFLDVFCPNGILERQIHIDLHNAFTKQFIHTDEIERIITNIKGSLSFESSSARIQKIFQRIAVRTLLFELLLPEIDEQGNLVEETVSTTEHYLRRVGKIPVWTGDIFRKKHSESFLFVLTPRCNVIRTDSVLVCPFIWKDIIKKRDKISKMLQGDPTVSGYDRHLPPSPIFEGGKLALSKYYMIDKVSLISDYDLVVTLSDELTNEILGKFGSHFFRTGITPWDANEAAGEIAGR